MLAAIKCLAGVNAWIVRLSELHGFGLNNVNVDDLQIERLRSDDVRVVVHVLLLETAHKPDLGEIVEEVDADPHAAELTDVHEDLFAGRNGLEPS